MGERRANPPVMSGFRGVPILQVLLVELVEDERHAPPG